MGCLGIDGDKLKDAAHGQGYMGATTPAGDIAYAARHGIHLWEVCGSSDRMVVAVKTELAWGCSVCGAIRALADVASAK